VSTDILSLSHVTVAQRGPRQPGLTDLNLALASGTIVFVRIEHASDVLPLADVAQGLLTPDSGTVEFRGRNWARVRPGRAARMRGRIGRVFPENTWLSNLDLLENVVLRVRHNSLRRDSEIMDELAALAEALNVPMPGHSRPADLQADDSRAMQWLRALLGDPVLLVLEQPELGIAPGRAARFAERILAAAAEGAAVLWITGSRATLEHPGFREAGHFAMQGDRVIPDVEEK